MTDAIPARLRRLREALVREQVDALLVSALANARYLTGFTGSNALVLVTARRCVLLTDFRYEQQAQSEAGQGVEVRIEPASLWVGLWEELGADPSPKVVGVEAAHLSLRDHERCREQGTRWHWRSTTGLVEGLRAIKEQAEVDAIRRAGLVATRALAEVVPHVTAGMSELELCGVLEHALRRGGSEAHPFPPIVATGERSALPHARPGRRRIAHGDFVLLDFGATVDGYVSDVTRTFVMGAPSPEQVRQYEVVRRAHAAALGGIRAGMTGREGDALAREVITEAGMGELFGHGLGHGIGLEVHEDPRISRLAEASLAEGSVVTIEPGVYCPGLGGVRLEDDVYVTAGGVELLTEFPRELQVIGG